MNRGGRLESLTTIRRAGLAGFFRPGSGVGGGFLFLPASPRGPPGTPPRGGRREGAPAGPRLGAPPSPAGGTTFWGARRSRSTDDQPEFPDPRSLPRQSL